MSTTEIKRELHRFIDKGDDKFVKMFHEMAKAYTVQIEKDTMIREGEDEIRNGQVYALSEAREKLKDWKEK